MEDWYTTEDEWNAGTSKIEVAHHTIGFKDGVEEGMKVDLQTGFDDGFRIAATNGLELGILMGRLQSHQSISTEMLDKDLEKQMKELSHLYLSGDGVKEIFDLKAKYQAKLATYKS